VAEEIARTLIRPTRSGVPIRLGQIWSYRELFYFLVWRDVKVRYKQSTLGVAWAVLQPLFTMVIFTVFFGRLAGVPSDGVPYPLFAFAGLLPWTFFSSGVTNGGNSLISNSSLITKVYFPRVLIPGAAIGASVVDFLVAFVLLLGLMGVYGVRPTAQMVWLPLVFGLLLVLAMSVSILLAGLNVKYRDIRHALPFFIQSLLFASPVIYPVSFVPERWRWLLALNPLSGILDAFRGAMLGKALDWHTFGISAVLTAALLWISLHFFRRMERQFADVV
jgi:lipopolysaccharide transport system permease protein